MSVPVCTPVLADSLVPTPVPGSPLIPTPVRGLVCLCGGGRGSVHDGLLAVLALVLLARAGASLALQDSLTVLVHLELHDHHLGGVDANVYGGAVDLLTLDSLDVDDKLLAVDLDDLADLLTLVVTPHHLDFVVLADGDAAAVVLGAEILGEGRAHDLAPDVRGSVEVSLALLAPGRRDELVELHVSNF